MKTINVKGGGCFFSLSNPNLHYHPFSINKEGKFLHDLINNHSNSTFKDHNCLVLIIFVEQIIDNC